MFGDPFIVTPSSENRIFQKEAYFFEYIGIITFFFVLLNTLRSRTIFYFEAHSKVAQNSLFLRLERKGRIKKIDWNDIDETIRYSPYENVINDTDNYFTAEKCSKGPISLLESFFQSNRVREAYKKAFALRIYEQYRPNLFIRHLFEQYKEIQTIYCVPKEPVTDKPAVSIIVSDIPKDRRVIIPWKIHLISVLRNFGEKIKILSMLCIFPVWVLIKTGIPSFHQNEKKDFSIGIRVYKTDFAFFQKYRSINFLIDGKKILAETTLFCIETDISQNYHNDLKKRGYICIDLRSILHHADMDFVKNTLLMKYFPLWMKATILSVIESPNSILTTLEAIHTGLIWELFCRKYYCKYYIAYNDTIPKHIIRNVVLAKNDIHTCSFIYSCNTPDYYTPKGIKEFHHVYFSYLNYESLVSWSDKVTRFYRTHPNTIGSFVEVGCLWSESILDIKSLNLKNECKYQVNKEIIERNKSYPEKTIAVFDTSFGGETIFKSEDILEFLRGILELIENHPEYAMIFKMKIPWGYHTILSPDIKKYYTLLSNHPRCVLLNGFDIELSEVIAAADFVISACFTSPTIEAWGAKIPSIYYDATSRFKGYYYDNFPKFVAHDYQELEKLVEYWFKNTGSDELEHYINKWIIPEIDKFADGKGLTRFRNLLIQSEKNEISQPTDF